MAKCLVRITSNSKIEYQKSELVWTIFKKLSFCKYVLGFKYLKINISNKINVRIFLKPNLTKFKFVSAGFNQFEIKSFQVNKFNFLTFFLPFVGSVQSNSNFCVEPHCVRQKSSSKSK